MKYEFFFIHKKDYNIQNYKNYNLTFELDFCIKLNSEQIRRLFNNDLPLKENNKVYSVHIVSCKIDKMICKEEFNDFYFDCCEEIYKFLENNRNCLGFSSISQNKKIKALLFGNNDIKTYLTTNNDMIKELKGETKWESLQDYFEALTVSYIPYVVLRKYENLPNSFIENDKDLDILCENKKEFILFSNAVKRSAGISGYMIKVGYDWIPLDIRYLGDGYYDSAWEKDILNSRFINDKNISIMSKDNQIFSIIYHSLTQKKEISEYYCNQIQKLSKNLSMDIELYHNNYIKLLILYMKRNSYLFCKPKDISVYQNKRNIKILKKELNMNKYSRKLFLKFISLLPNFITNLIPDKILKGDIL